MGFASRRESSLRFTTICDHLLIYFQWDNNCHQLTWFSFTMCGWAPSSLAVWSRYYLFQEFKFFLLYGW